MVKGFEGYSRDKIGGNWMTLDMGNEIKVRVKNYSQFLSGLG